MVNSDVRVQEVDPLNTHKPMVHIMKSETGIAGLPARAVVQGELVQQCLVPGPSVAAIALAGGTNANRLFKTSRSLGLEDAKRAAIVVGHADSRARRVGRLR